jgi:hypothetical protein
MAGIHYFQRFSQKENVATNNTLLLFSRLYHYSPLIFAKCLTEMLGDKDIEPGIMFTQQMWSENSVPDGIINQSAFKIVIETKLSHLFNLDQLQRHLSSFHNEERKILLLLGTELQMITLEGNLLNGEVLCR